MEIDVGRIAQLARLPLEGQELAMLEKQMEEMVAMVALLPVLSPEESGDEPPDTMMLRADEVRASATREDLLRNAPTCEDGFFVVPRDA